MSRKFLSWAVAGAWGVVLTAAAQPPGSPAPPQDVVFFAAGAAPLPALRTEIEIVRGEGAAAGPVVENKPYSARSITESTQTLADGNRITQRNEARIYRDSRGRTRREQTLAALGPWQAAGEPVTMITINDPVAGKGYVLDPVARTAREIQPFQIAIARADGGAPAWVAADTAGQSGQSVGADNGLVTVVRRTFAGPEPGGVVAAAVGTAPFAVTAAASRGVEEDLGEQVLEGLLARGSRTTQTIAPGVMGNERAIEIVTERWYSADIEALVRHRHADPRFGETSYELVNVVRGDPSPDLFSVPEGYAVSIESGPALALPAPPAAGVRTFTLQREVPVSE